MGASETPTMRRARKVIVGTCVASAPSAHVNMCVMTQTAEAKNSAALERHTHEMPTLQAAGTSTRIEFGSGVVPARNRDSNPSFYDNKTKAKKNQPRHTHT